MDASVILVIVFGAIFCIGGPITVYYASKGSRKAEKEELNKVKDK